MITLCEAALDVLECDNAIQKAQKSRAHAQDWRDGAIPNIGTAPNIKSRPARPEKPELRPAREMPKRRKAGTDASKVALLHAIAHIELNAIDLAWDIMARFSKYSDENTKDGFSIPRAFFNDWVKVADDEAKHFLMLEDRLNDFDATYGDLPAHDGLWEASERTAEDFAARLAIVPMVLEARGLDVTPGMIEIFKRAKADGAVTALETIYAEEVAHVAYGSKWFHFLCGRFDEDPKERFHALVRKYFHGHLKPPFNEEKRAEAGIPPDFYWPLTETGEP